MCSSCRVRTPSWRRTHRSNTQRNSCIGNWVCAEKLGSAKIKWCRQVLVDEHRPPKHSGCGSAAAQAEALAWDVPRALPVPTSCSVVCSSQHGSHTRPEGPKQPSAGGSAEHMRPERLRRHLSCSHALLMLQKCVCNNKISTQAGRGGSRGKGQCQNQGDRASSRSFAPASTYRVAGAGTGPREVAAISALPVYRSERGCF